MGLCLWQLWSSLGESVLEVDVCFHGVTAAPSALFIDGGAAWSQTMIRRAHTYGAPHIDSRTGAVRASRQLHPELDLCSKVTASACIAASHTLEPLFAAPLEASTAMHGSSKIIECLHTPVANTV